MKIFLVFFMFIFGCNIDVTQYEEIIKIKIQELGMDSEVFVNEMSKNSILIDIIYNGGEFKNEFSDFFLDKQSNEIIVNLLTLELYRSYSNLTNIEYKIGFQGYPDVLKKDYSKSELDALLRISESSVKVLEFAVTNMRYKGVIRADQFIDYILINYPNKFTYSGSFWELLNSYSRATINPPENAYELYSFLVFAASFSEYGEKTGNEENSEWMKYFLRVGGFDSRLLNYSSEEIAVYLENRFGFGNSR